MDSSRAFKTNVSQIYAGTKTPKKDKMVLKKQEAKAVSEVGFEPTPGEPDCDLNAAP